MSDEPSDELLAGFDLEVVLGELRLAHPGLLDWRLAALARAAEVAYLISRHGGWHGPGGREIRRRMFARWIESTGSVPADLARRYPAEGSALLAARAGADVDDDQAHPRGWKRCWRCRRYKAVGQYPRNSAHPDGRGSTCRACDREIQQDRRDRLRLGLFDANGYDDHGEPADDQVYDGDQADDDDA